MQDTSTPEQVLKSAVQYLEDSEKEVLAFCAMLTSLAKGLTCQASNASYFSDRPLQRHSSFNRLGGRLDQLKEKCERLSSIMLEIVRDMDSQTILERGLSRVSKEGLAENENQEQGSAEDVSQRIELERKSARIVDLSSLQRQGK